MKMLVTQSYPTLCNPVDCNPPDSSVHGILQTRILEWVAIPFSVDLPNPGVEPTSLALQEDSLPSEAPGKPHQAKQSCLIYGALASLIIAAFSIEKSLWGSFKLFNSFLTCSKDVS